MSLALSDLADAVAADFAARSIAVDVLFGDWNAQLHNTGNRVIVGVATTFEDADLGPANTPGPVELGDTPATAARTLYTMSETATVWVHSAPVGDEEDPDRLRNTHKATMALVKQVLRAMYRAAPGAFGWGQGAFPKPEASEFRYGALATFKAMLLTPVLDDAQPVQTASGYSAQIYATMPNDGDVLVGTITKELP